MKKIIECVPNISEGSDTEKIETIIKSLQAVGDVKIADLYVGKDTNRTVFTMFAEPKVIQEAAFVLISKCKDLIDMSKHKGIHPRMGAVDVCPFVPVKNTTINDCINIAQSLGERVGNKLMLPVYLYGEAALSSQNKNLADIRKGEYESLRDKLKIKKPDFGPAEYDDTVNKFGAVAIGARSYLIAFNVNLNTNNLELAKKIAANIRESGTGVNKLQSVKAIAWYIPEFSCVQLSFNLINYEVTPLHVLYNTCVKQAESCGLMVTGSELVGMLPKKVLIDAGLFFNQAVYPSLNKLLNDEQLIELAVQKMGLNSCTKIDINSKIIENCFGVI